MNNENCRKCRERSDLAYRCLEVRYNALLEILTKEKMLLTKPPTICVDAKFVNEVLLKQNEKLKTDNAVCVSVCKKYADSIDRKTELLKRFIQWRFDFPAIESTGIGLKKLDQFVADCKKELWDDSDQRVNESTNNEVQPCPK